MTGPDALSFKEIAAILGGRYEEETVEQAYASRAHLGAPDWEVEAWVSSYLAIADGSMVGVTDQCDASPGTRPHPSRI